VRGTSSNGGYADPGRLRSSAGHPAVRDQPRDQRRERALSFL